MMLTENSALRGLRCRPLLLRRAPPSRRVGLRRRRPSRAARSRCPADSSQAAWCHACRGRRRACVGKARTRAKPARTGASRARGALRAPQNAAQRRFRVPVEQS